MTRGDKTSPLENEILENTTWTLDQLKKSGWKKTDGVRGYQMWRSQYGNYEILTENHGSRQDPYTVRHVITKKYNGGIR